MPDPITEPIMDTMAPPTVEPVIDTGTTDAGGTTTVSDGAISSTPTTGAAITPEPPGYVAPDVSAPTFQPREVAEAETVEGRLNKLLDSDSKFIEQGRQEGIEYATSRGLLNTSIAAGAAERERIKAGMPIATQDADTFRTAAQSAQDAEQLAGLEGFRGEISGSLSDQEFRESIGLESFAQSATMSREDKETYAKLSSGIKQTYSDNYLKIQQTADTIMDATAKRVSIEALNRSTRSQFEMLNSIYEVDMTWDDGLSLSSFTGDQVIDPDQPQDTGGDVPPPVNSESILTGGNLGSVASMDGVNLDTYNAFKTDIGLYGYQDSAHYQSVWADHKVNTAYKPAFDNIYTSIMYIAAGGTDTTAYDTIKSSVKDFDDQYFAKDVITEGDAFRTWVAENQTFFNSLPKVWGGAFGGYVYA